MSVEDLSRGASAKIAADGFTSGTLLRSSAHVHLQKSLQPTLQDTECDEPARQKENVTPLCLDHGYSTVQYSIGRNTPEKF